MLCSVSGVQLLVDHAEQLFLGGVVSSGESCLQRPHKEVYMREICGCRKIPIFLLGANFMKLAWRKQIEKCFSPFLIMDVQ